MGVSQPHTASASSPCLDFSKLPEGLLRPFLSKPRLTTDSLEGLRQVSSAAIKMQAAAQNLGHRALAHRDKTIHRALAITALQCRNLKSCKTLWLYSILWPLDEFSRQTILKFNKTNNNGFYVVHSFVGSRLCFSFCQFLAVQRLEAVLLFYMIILLLPL